MIVAVTVSASRTTSIQSPPLQATNAAALGVGYDVRHRPGNGGGGLTAVPHANRSKLFTESSDASA
jgi:hypothetical protein